MGRGDTFGENRFDIPGTIVPFISELQMSLNRAKG